MSNVNTRIAQEIEGYSVFDQSLIDRVMIELDGTQQGKLGANAISGCITGCRQSCSHGAGQPLYRYIGGVNANTLPVPMMNILNGAVTLITLSFSGVYGDAGRRRYIFRCVAHGGGNLSHLEGVLHDKGLSTNVGDEGFALTLSPTRKPLKLY